MEWVLRFLKVLLTYLYTSCATQATIFKGFLFIKHPSYFNFIVKNAFILGHSLGGTHEELNNKLIEMDAIIERVYNSLLKVCCLDDLNWYFFLLK